MSDETKTIWVGKQWQVDAAGLSEVPGDDQGYWIAVADLYNGSDDAAAGWPAHMAGKKWVDFEEFVKAYLIACVAHGVALANIGEIVEVGYSMREAALRIGPIV